MPTKKPEVVDFDIKCPHCNGLIRIRFFPKMIAEMHKAVKVNMLRANEILKNIMPRVYKIDLDALREEIQRQARRGTEHHEQV